MGIFWLIAAAMIAVSLALVLPPMLGRGRSEALTRSQLNLATYRDRLAELEAARATGTLGEEDYGQARADLERSMLDDLEAARAGDAAARGERRASPVAAVVVAVAVPVVAFGVYLQLGSRQALEGVAQEEPQPSAHITTADGQQLSIEQMITRLEERLRQRPDDAQGWLMLGRTYAFTKRDEPARDAFKKAVELSPKEPLALVGYAETLTRLAGGQVTGEASEYAERALEIDPDIQPALWLTGMGAFQRGDNATALERWQRIREIGGLNLDSARVLETFITRAGGAPAADATAAQGSGAPAAGPEPAAQAAAGAPGGSLKVRVAIAPAVASDAAPGDTVFIFARAATGPPMPLAVVRRTVADLPVTVTLDDSMAMLPQMRLSAFPEVVVGARVSRSGAPTATSGDLQGLAPPVRVAEAGLVEVAIDKIVP